MTLLRCVQSLDGGGGEKSGSGAWSRLTTVAARSPAASPAATLWISATEEKNKRQKLHRRIHEQKNPIFAL
jgi:hypothetical protein